MIFVIIRKLILTRSGCIVLVRSWIVHTCHRQWVSLLWIDQSIACRLLVLLLHLQLLLVCLWRDTLKWALRIDIQISHLINLSGLCATRYDHWRLLLMYHFSSVVGSASWSAYSTAFAAFALRSSRFRIKRDLMRLQLLRANHLLLMLHFGCYRASAPPSLSN